jgi:hypothetical protein
LLVTAGPVVLSTAGQAAVYYLPDFPLRDSIANLFYVRMEQNVPTTLYSPMMLLVAAFAVRVHRLSEESDGPHLHAPMGGAVGRFGLALVRRVTAWARKWRREKPWR